MRLIDADALIEDVRKHSESYFADDFAHYWVNKQPTIEPERKTGRWIESNPQDSKLCRLMTCSECGKAYIVNINVPYEDWTEAHKFCVECGADMRGEQE